MRKSRYAQLDENSLALVEETMKTTGEGWFALDLAEVTKLHPGDLYSILRRLENMGRVTSGWVYPKDGPRRMLYTLLPELETR